VFQCIGKPIFFDQAVNVILGRVAEILRDLDPITQTREELWRLIQSEARSLARELEGRFVETGVLELPAIA